MDVGRIAFLAAVLALLPAVGHAQGKRPGKNVHLYIVSPQDGATVKSPLTVVFGLRGMGITHAGDDFPNSGHHHLLIDVNTSLSLTEPMPHNKNYIHYAAGQTEAQIDLPPGKHTLQLVLSDSKHYSFNPPVVSKQITVTVR
jgi:hypothetical protein